MIRNFRCLSRTAIAPEASRPSDHRSAGSPARSMTTPSSLPVAFCFHWKRLATAQVVAKAERKASRRRSAGRRSGNRDCRDTVLLSADAVGMVIRRGILGTLICWNWSTTVSLQRRLAAFLLLSPQEALERQECPSRGAIRPGAHARLDSAFGFRRPSAVSQMRLRFLPPRCPVPRGAGRGCLRR